MEKAADAERKTFTRTVGRKRQLRVSVGGADVLIYRHKGKLRVSVRGIADVSDEPRRK